MMVFFLADSIDKRREIYSMRRLFSYVLCTPILVIASTPPGIAPSHPISALISHLTFLIAYPLDTHAGYPHSSQSTLVSSVQ